MGFHVVTERLDGLTSRGNNCDDKAGVLTVRALSKTESPPSVSRANVGLSTMGRFLFPLVGVRSPGGSAEGPESFRRKVWVLLGLERTSIPSKPSAIPHVLSFLGVAGPSFRLDFARPSPSLRS